MLFKEFFLTDPNNIGPYPVISLGGGQSYISYNQIYKPGKYHVEIQAGSSFCGNSSTNPLDNVDKLYQGVGGRIITDVVVKKPFRIIAYCGSKGTYNSAGVNAYSGEFKVNPSNSAVPAVTHVFGNAGGLTVNTDAVEGMVFSGGGNCLGDGILKSFQWGQRRLSYGAGSCLHFVNADTTTLLNHSFLCAFHCTAGTSGSYTSEVFFGGTGSAFGGAGAGSYSYRYQGAAYNGGSTVYGSGGSVNTSIGTTPPSNPGGNGSGIGYGAGGGINAHPYIGAGTAAPQPGAAAWYDGHWHDSRDVGGVYEDGKIIVNHIGPVE